MGRSALLTRPRIGDDRYVTDLQRGKKVSGKLERGGRTRESERPYAPVLPYHDMRFIRHCHDFLKMVISLFPATFLQRKKLYEFSD